MLGLILCGGQSSRMKDDKGLLLLNKETWAMTVLKKLTSLNLQTVLSIRQEQFQNYSSLFAKEQLVLDNKELEIAGPLLGILSAHIRFPSEDFLVLACDLPNMQTAVLTELLDQFKENKHCEAVAFKFGELTEPLCSIYSAKGLSKILSQYNNKQLRKFSMMNVLETLQTKFIIGQESWKPFFKNFNSPEDLAGLNG